MIKVNLLATTPGIVPKREWLPKEQRTGAIGAAMLFATGLAIGGGWYYLNGQRDDFTARIGAAETELARLKEASTLVERTEARKADLAERLDVIGRLGGAKREPVNLLQAVSRSIPNGLWLLELRQAGASVEVDGRAISITAITDFSQNLQTSGTFERPVEILTTTAETVEDTPVLRFTVRASVAPPTPGQQSAGVLPAASLPAPSLPAPVVPAAAAPIVAAPSAMPPAPTAELPAERTGI